MNTYVLDSSTSTHTHQKHSPTILHIHSLHVSGMYGESKGLKAKHLKALPGNEVLGALGHEKLRHYSRPSLYTELRPCEFS